MKQFSFWGAPCHTARRWQCWPWHPWQEALGDKQWNQKSAILAPHGDIEGPWSDRCPVATQKMWLFGFKRFQGHTKWWFTVDRMNSIKLHAFCEPAAWLLPKPKPCRWFGPMSKTYLTATSMCPGWASQASKILKTHHMPHARIHFFNQWWPGRVLSWDLNQPCPSWSTSLRSTTQASKEYIYIYLDWPHSTPLVPMLLWAPRFHEPWPHEIKFGRKKGSYVEIQVKVKWYLGTSSLQLYSPGSSSTWNQHFDRNKSLGF